MENNKVIEVDYFNWQKEVIMSNHLVLVDFYAEWCGPCRMLAPLLKTIAEEYGDKITVCKVNIDDCQKIASDYNVMSIPTLLLFKGGKVVDKSIGLISNKDLKFKIDSNIRECINC